MSTQCCADLTASLARGIAIESRRRGRMAAPFETACGSVTHARGTPAELLVWECRARQSATRKLRPASVRETRHERHRRRPARESPMPPEQLAAPTAMAPLAGDPCARREHAAQALRARTSCDRTAARRLRQSATVFAPAGEAATDRCQSRTRVTIAAPRVAHRCLRSAC